MGVEREMERLYLKPSGRNLRSEVRNSAWQEMESVRELSSWEMTLVTTRRFSCTVGRSTMRTHCSLLASRLALLQRGGSEGWPEGVSSVRVGGGGGDGV